MPKQKSQKENSVKKNNEKHYNINNQDKDIIERYSMSEKPDIIKSSSSSRPISIDEIYFPHEKIRNVQDELVADIIEAINKKQNLVAHAPTGLGKTAASLAPVLTYALKNNKTVFFLTSRHTQHKIAIDTLRDIKERHAQDFIVTDIIGKKHMCLQDAIENLYSSEFMEFCKNLREDGTCEFYNNTYENGKMKLSFQSEEILNDLRIIGTNTSKQIMHTCDNSTHRLCPYEISYQLAKNAKVIIGDYYHMFNPFIQTTFLKKIGKKLEDCIIIVDEAHNLPSRLRELMSEKLSLIRLDRAIKEAKKYRYQETRYILNKIKDKIVEFGDDVPKNDTELLITRKDVVEKISEIDEYDKIVEDLIFIGDEIRKEHKRSYIATIGELLHHWKNTSEEESITNKTPEELEKSYVCYIKIDTKNTDIIIFSRCLDPSIVSEPIIKEAHSVIMMSGTLSPVAMYADLLGFDKKTTIMKELPCPFPKENKLSLVVPQTSTKFTERSESQYKKIATLAVNITNTINGNVAIFFPSYYIKLEVEKYFKQMYKNIILSENQSMNSEDRHQLIEDFKNQKDEGAVLLAVSSGSYGEGIDLPGDFLKGVIVVGLPLGKPDLETKELINYFDDKFRRGWDYGYLFPAFNKTLQNAGRCIRTHNDKGIIVYLDERYAWNNYYRCFPKNSNVKITKNFIKEIKEFFEGHDNNK